MVAVGVDPESEPPPVTTDQITPALLGSLFTVAVTNCVFPWSRVTGLAGDSPTVIGGLIVMLRLLDETVLPTESVTCTAKCKVPAVAGVPVTMPLLAPIVSGANEPEATAKV